MGDVEGFFYYLQEGLFWRFMLISLFFAFNQALWSFLAYNDYLKDAGGYVRALDVYSYVLTAVYYLWFTTFLKGYSEPAQEYRRILLHVDIFCQKFYAFATTSSSLPS